MIKKNKPGIYWEVGMNTLFIVYPNFIVEYCNPWDSIWYTAKAGNSFLENIMGTDVFIGDL